MAVALRKVEQYTPEEYLALEEIADYKSEYFQGMIYECPEHRSTTIGLQAVPLPLSSRAAGDNL